MKTLLVYGLKNVIGGIENYLMMMHKYLHQDLKFVFVVEEADEFIYAKQIEENNGEIVFLPERHNFGSYREKLQKILKGYRGVADIFYVNVGHISFDIIPIKMALSEGYKVITHSHSAMQEPIKSIPYRIRQGVLRTVAMIQLRNAKVERLAVSERAGDYLYKGKSYQIVSPGIEVTRYRYDPQVRAEVRERYSLANDFVLGFVGRFVAVKNPLFLLDILYDVKQHIPNTKLFLVGDGALKEEMIDKANRLNLGENMVFVGEVKQTEDYYQAMDVLLAPSLSEGMPLGIMEAQSEGVPCICAKGNFPENIDVTGLVGFCSLESGAEAWSNKAQAIFSMEINRFDMNETVKKSSLNIENAAKKLLEVLE